MLITTSEREKRRRSDLSPQQVEDYASLFEMYREDWVFFIHHALGHYTWSKQREIIESVRNNKLTAVRACHGSSKTYTAAEVAVCFLNLFPDSKVITTAPTHPQVEMLLWSEINKIYETSRLKLVGECFTTKIRTEQADSYAVGFSTDKPARAEGWHSPSILFIFDEAKGIQQWLWDSVRGLMTGGLCRWLAISTTDGVEVGEQFYNIFMKKNHWNKIHISAFDCPHVTGEKFQYIDEDDWDKPEVSEIAPEELPIQLADTEYIEECKEEWQEESVLFLSKVRGELSDQAADTIIKNSQVMRMFDNAKLKDFDDTGRWELGVDVARGGMDDTTFFLRKGLKVMKTMTITSKQLPILDKTGFIADRIEDFVDLVPRTRNFKNDCLIKVDDTGVGGGVTDQLERRNYEVQPIIFNSKADDEDRYQDAISEAWFEVSRILHEISCPENTRLQTELVNRKAKKQDKRGRRGVESKDDYKKRGFRSPDYADGFLMCFYERKGKEGALLISEEDAY
jgi:hypothetical protein